MVAVLEAKERVQRVHLEGLALLKIIKHCHDSLPHMVTGSLLGLTTTSPAKKSDDNNNKGAGAVGAVLEITHAFPFPDPSTWKQQQQGHNKFTDDADNNNNGSSLLEGGPLEGHEYQLEMMRMLREVNVDNNCVGWYQSMYLGIYSTRALLENQLSYQLDLSPQAIVLLYDPIQTRQGMLGLKCVRLSDAMVQQQQPQVNSHSTANNNPSTSTLNNTHTGPSTSVDNPQDTNAFIDPSTIFEEVPITLTNPGLATAFLADLQYPLYPSPEPMINNNNDNVFPDVALDRLDLSTHPFLEKHLELMGHWTEQLTAEQAKFQYYARSHQQQYHHRNHPRDRDRDHNKRLNMSSADAPRRLESLLLAQQMNTYCARMHEFAMEEGVTKLYVSSGLQPPPQTQTQPQPQPSPSPLSPQKQQ